MTAVTVRILIGVLISLSDYLWSYRSYVKRRGVDRHRECLLSIEILLDNPHPSDINDPGYGEALAVVQDYLRSEGILQSDAGLIQRIRTSLSRFSHREKINNTSVWGLFLIALGLEIIYDLSLGFYLASLQGHGLTASILADIYQVPLLFAGLYSGRYIKKGLHWFLVTGEKRRMEKTIQQCIIHTPLLDYIVAFQNRQKENADAGAAALGLKLSRKGLKIFDQIKDLTASVTEKGKKLADEVIHSPDKTEDDMLGESERSDRFDDLTKGR